MYSNNLPTIVLKYLSTHHILLVSRCAVFMKTKMKGQSHKDAAEVQLPSETVLLGVVYGDFQKYYELNGC
jgi:activator of 2-hydroxyglutaryl-CoA dehydratase